MKLKTKAILLAMLGLMTVFFITGCGGEPTPYETNNADQYTVSVRFDANGGYFTTTNIFTIVDSFNIKGMETNSEGMVELPLITPDNPAREKDAFKAINNGYFLVGWYENRIETTDEQGNVTYTYSGKWDFENDVLTVDPNKEYNSEEPEITLYAAWAPLFEIQFYSVDNTEVMLESYLYDPTLGEAIQAPAWDETTGKMEMYRFPEKTGCTFNAAYYDTAKTEVLNTEDVMHKGVVDYEKGIATDNVMKLYIEYKDGEWYRIYNAEQLIDNANAGGVYEIMADLDFEGERWPSAFINGNFSGSIIGNGHTIKNVSFTQGSDSKINAGLFGSLTEEAVISDVTFENVTFTLDKVSRKSDPSYGLFAGRISENAVISGVKVLNSRIEIDSSCYFEAGKNYFIGLVCGMGDPTVVDTAEIQCTVVGDNPEKYVITVDQNDGNTVTVASADTQ